MLKLDLMEKSEGIIDSIKNWFGSRESPKSTTDTSESLLPKPIPGWDYETFREYVLALTKSRDALLPIEEYPSRIDLSVPWHEILNQIRPNTYESWALFGYQAGQRRLILPRVAEKGLDHSVPADVMLRGLERARLKTGIDDLIGDAHSHPRSSSYVNYTTPTEDAAFSLGDMYALLYDLTKQRPSDPKISMMFLAEGNMNVTAFATRRSLGIVRNNLPEAKHFKKYWYKRYGWSFNGSESASTGGGELATPDRPDASTIREINKAVAFHYQLALYRGMKNESLLREHPVRSNI